MNPNEITVDHMTNNITFTCHSMAGPDLIYTWLIDNNAVNNSNYTVINKNELMLNNITYLLGGTYTCVVTNMAGEGRDNSVLFGEL